MTSTYYIIFVVAAIAAIVFFISSVIMFLIFNIPKIIGILTGYTAKKQISQLKNSESAPGYSNHLDTFMEKQRNIANQVQKNPVKNDTADINETQTMNLVSPTVEVTENTQTINLAPPTVEFPERTQIMPETTFLEESSEHITGSLKDGFRFEIIFNINFINTDEVV